MREDLVLLAGCTSFNIVRDPIVHPDPFCVVLGFADSFISARVPCCGVIVSENHDELFLCFGEGSFF